MARLHEAKPRWVLAAALGAAIVVVPGYPSSHLAALLLVFCLPDAIALSIGNTDAFPFRDANTISICNTDAESISDADPDATADSFQIRHAAGNRLVSSLRD